MSSTRTVTIGKSDVVTTPLGLGANAVGGTNLFPGRTDESGREIVAAALDSGIDLIDTAFAYGLGHSEELIGQAIKGRDRSSFAIADKAAQDLSSGEAVINNDPAFLKKAVDDALGRLGTDYIDIFYIHFPDDHTPKAEAVGALHDLKEAGKIRAIGVSNFSLEQIQEADADGYVDVVENQFSLLHQAMAKDVMPYLEQHHIGFVPFFPLASGLLTGKYTKDSNRSFPASDIRSGMPDFAEPAYSRILAAVDRIRPIAQAHKATVTQIVLAWYIADPQISVVIPGAKRPEQVRSNAAAMGNTLTDDEYRAIARAFAGFAD